MSQNNKRELVEKIINVVIAILSAVLTTLGMNSCINF